MHPGACPVAGENIKLHINVKLLWHHSQEILVTGRAVTTTCGALSEPNMFAISQSAHFVVYLGPHHSCKRNG